MKEKIDVLKWACYNNYAEGFSLMKFGDDCIGYSYSIDVMETYSFGLGCIRGLGPNKDGFEKFWKIIWPLFLQKTIQGLIKNSEWSITHYFGGIEAEIPRVNDKFFSVSINDEKDSFDNAMFSVIKWIKENDNEDNFTFMCRYR
jgi:hypothetical protein